MAKLEKYRYPWKWRDEDDAEHAKLLADPKNHKHRSTKELTKSFDEQKAALDKLFEVSHNLPPGQVVGAVLSWGRGDGHAYYIVTKDKPLTLAWISYVDAWAVEEALIRGLTKKDVLAMLDRDKKMAELFGGKKKKAG